MKRTNVNYSIPLLLLLSSFLSHLTGPIVETQAIVSTRPSRINMTIYNSSNSRGFSWMTNQSVAMSSLEVVKKENDTPPNWEEAITIPATKADFFSGHRSWKAAVLDLEHDQTYYYRIIADSTRSQIYEFEVSGGQIEYNILHVTDYQNYTATEYELPRKTMRLARKRFGLPNNIINTGDLTQSNRYPESNINEWGYALDVLSEFYTKTVITPTSGNHDQALNMFANHFNVELPAEVDTSMGFYYSYDIDNIHITVLNTNDGLSMSTPLAPQQLTWLEDDLKNSNATWKIVVTHKGPFTTGRHALEGDVESLRRDLLPLFSKYHVDLVLQGHDHVYARTNPYYFDNSGVKPNLNAETKVIKEDNYNFTYHVEPGTFFVIPNTASGDEKNLSPITPTNELPSSFSLATSPVTNFHLNTQPNRPMYGHISIKEDRLMYKAYTVEFDDTDLLYDYFGIFKYTAKEASRKISLLPSSYSSNIKHSLAEAVDYFNHLSTIEKEKVSDELVEKISSLNRYTNPDAFRNSRFVVELINRLPQPSLNESYSKKLNEIQSHYDELSNIEKTFVENYSLFLKYFTNYNDRVLAAEVDALIMDADTLSKVEHARTVYESLTVEQKQFIENYFVLLRLENQFDIFGGNENEN